MDNRSTNRLRNGLVELCEEARLVKRSLRVMLFVISGH